VPGARPYAPGARPGAPGERPGIGSRQSIPSYARSGGGGGYNGRFNGNPIRNPHWPGGGGPWGWNHGRPWQAAGGYWGGGFWGPFAFADLGGFALYGALDYDQQVYDSYQVGPDSPGADLLQDYGLQQTQCGPGNLVDIWGPNNSLICAFPDDSVGPGNYQVDPSTFELVPASS
jgi:hypothetical protein